MSALECYASCAACLEGGCLSCDGPISHSHHLGDGLLYVWASAPALHALLVPAISPLASAAYVLALAG